ncbi:GrpB family protein [Myroides odoratus]|uniref:GrpB family protein n=1 Tax=Myroides odoratus TaxID=256 RepID=A0A9Q6ZCF5_MYROD|nr:GrpB family protein [Myroides odoratus]EHQ43815.1 protein of unknown function UPF0157 [Myroides odoratus DSM 2801]EKB04190.1 hypothetical protein HMPREF9716_03102 [Myroides odoratus CIP 103059]QQU01125.1 GrpB family protein [Myroides odoratus]WQD56620.1 GrpB family protein [Myroides odoratus]STZ31092.1 dephospho-CoA kinase/protein folding accessory domain-containing protein [Myroides odoratus]
MILPFEPYNPKWKEQFEKIKSELALRLKELQPRIEHIGSTSVEGLAAKPIIDIMVGVRNEEELEVVPALLAGQNYVYYPKYNVDMPYRRYFVLLHDAPSALALPEVIDVQDEIPEKMHDHNLRLAHIHVIPTTSENWTRHLAFRDYLRTHPSVKAAYQALKEQLVQQQWETGNDYNDGKDAFIQREEQNAIRWYKENEK